MRCDICQDFGLLHVQYRDGSAFAATTVTMASAIVAIFTALYPNVMVSSTSAANNLTAANTASPAYPLKIMSVVAIILLPVVLIYQAWTYYVFRRRVSAREFQPQAPSPAPAPPGTPSAPVGKTAS